MNFSFTDGHAVPSHEHGQHVLADQCPCGPALVKAFNGLFCCKHNCLDFSDLVECADMIRMVASVELMRDNVTPHNHQILAFPEECKEVMWPPSTNRIPEKLPELTDYDWPEDPEEYEL